MKFNLTYSQKINLRETLKWNNHIEKVIWNWAQKKFNLSNISIPLYQPEDSSLLTTNLNVSRNITFDSVFENRTFSFNNLPSNILRFQMKKMDFKENEGLITKFTKIRRDIEEDPIKSLSRDEIVFQFIVSKDKSTKIIDDISQEIYKIIYSIAEEISAKHKIRNILPKELKNITSQQLSNEYPNFSRDGRMETFIMETEAFILKAAGAKQFSGQRDKFIEPEIYDLIHHNEIYFRDRVNNAPIHIATISRLASGEELDDQLQKYSKTELKQYDFYSRLIKEKNKIIEISVSVPAISMVLLNKAHISETQSGVYTDEALTLENKYKVEVF